jgi:glycine/D-amino acid oxidase-like deaminating enzyme
MNLVTGKLYWPETLPDPPRYPSLTEDIACDVVIIGGGEAGALSSYFLMQHGVDVVLVDKQRIAEGSSSANTGLLQFSNDKSLTSCIHSFGVEKGHRFYQLCREAVDQLEGIAKSLEIFPDYIRRDCLYYASHQEDVEALRTEYPNLKTHGFPVTFLEQIDVERRFSFSKPGAIYSTGDAEFNPYKLAHGVIADSARKGMRVFEDTEIVHQKEDDGDLVLTSKKGYRLRCKRAVFATGYATQAMKRNPNAVLSSSSVIVTNRVGALLGWPGACLIWETARPYLYIRTCPEGRIIVGGLDEPHLDPPKRDATILGKRDQLLQKVQELFPQIPLRAEYYWSGTFCGTHDGLPLFGEQDEYPNCLFSLGYGGNGTVYSTIGGQIITDLIIKGSHPDAELFSFNRVKTPSVVS